MTISQSPFRSETGFTSPGFSIDTAGNLNITGSIKVNNLVISNTILAGTKSNITADILSSSDGSGIQQLNASNLSIGTIPIGRIGIGGTANNTTFLRGDNTWQEISFSSINASNLTSGTVPLNRLGISGNPSVTTYLNGENKWVAFNTVVNGGSPNASFNGISSVKIKIRSGTEADWVAANPLLEVGELALETDTLRYKTGNGLTLWNSLPYSFSTIGGAETLTNKILTSPTITSPIISSPSITNNNNEIVLPEIADTLVGRTTTDTLLNKTLIAPIINSPIISNNSNQLALPTIADTLVGRITTDTLSNKTITGLKETKVALSGNAIDILSGNYFTKTITVNTTFTISNTPAAGVVASFVLELINAGAYTITWWSNMKWASGAPPVLTSAGRDSLAFYTHDNGTTWTGLILGKDIR